MKKFFLTAFILTSFSALANDPGYIKLECKFADLLSRESLVVKITDTAELKKEFCKDFKNNLKVCITDNDPSLDYLTQISVTVTRANDNGILFGSKNVLMNYPSDFADKQNLEVKINETETLKCTQRNFAK